MSTKEILDQFRSMTDDQLSLVQGSWYDSSLRDAITELWFERNPVEQDELEYQRDVCNGGKP